MQTNDMQYIKEFSRIFDNQNWLEAVKYKDSIIPKELYKYYPLFDERFSNYDNENKVRLNTLHDNKLWLSHYKKLNDHLNLKCLF